MKPRILEKQSILRERIEFMNKMNSEDDEQTKAALVIQNNWKKHHQRDLNNCDKFISDRIKMYQAKTNIEYVNLSHQTFIRNKILQKNLIKNRKSINLNEISVQMCCRCHVAVV